MSGLLCWRRQKMRHQVQMNIECDCPVCMWSTYRRYQDLDSDEQDLAQAAGLETGFSGWEVENARYDYHDGRLFMIDAYPVPQ